MNPDDGRKLAGELFNRVWELMEKPAQQHGIADWDLAYAYEALARAHTTAGHATEVTRYKKLARDAGDGITKAEDREHFDEDYATL